MYHVSAQGIDERMINVHYYYYNFSTKDDKFVFWCPCHLTYYKCTFIYFHIDLTFLMQPVNRSDAETEVTEY